MKLSDIEKNDDELLNSKSKRSKIEYYFTLSPCLPLYLLKEYNLPHICTLDADILFCDSPQSIFEKLDNFSIIITPHKFSKELLNLVEFGNFDLSKTQFEKNINLDLPKLSGFGWNSIAHSRSFQRQL